MKASEARLLLLKQHRDLEAQLDECERLARGTLHGAVPVAELQERLSTLAGALREHNVEEELHLRPLLQESDAWGPLRVERMIEEHVREHSELRDAFEELARAPLGIDERARRVIDAVCFLRSHIVEEESEFLTPELIRDDVITEGLSG